jgi:nucleoside-diphosphate-sugar epimerase
MSSLKNRRILITGATGFVGSNLARRALEACAEVHVLTRDAADRWRINDIIENVQDYRGDLTDFRSLESIVSEIRPEVIFHTAAYGVSPDQKDFGRIMESNFIGTANLLNVCKKIGFDLFVNTGSFFEYGPKSFPSKEEDLPEPLNDYGVSKAAATLYCQSVARRDRLPVVTLRLFSPYGKYEEPARLVPSAIMASLNGENPRISSPAFVRDFVFIEDVIDAYLRAVEAPGIGGEIINIGGGKQHSVGEVADRIIELTGGMVASEVGEPLRWAHEPTICQADISKAGSLLGWRPRNNLEMGLATTVRWFRENLSLYEHMHGGLGELS